MSDSAGRVLTPIERPNGKTYRPRRLVAHPVTDWDDNVEAVVVFGTHDPAVAHEEAQKAAVWFVDQGYEAVFDRAVWWRDGMQSGNRMWLTDEERGRAGCLFDIEEKPMIAPARVVP